MGRLTDRRPARGDEVVGQVMWAWGMQTGFQSALPLSYQPAEAGQAGFEPATPPLTVVTDQRPAHITGPVRLYGGDGARANDFLWHRAARDAGYRFRSPAWSSVTAA